MLIHAVAGKALLGQERADIPVEIQGSQGRAGSQEKKEGGAELHRHLLETLMQPKKLSEWCRRVRGGLWAHSR
jgi:hypothetical protein